MDTYGSYIWQTFSPPTGQAWSTKGLFLISAKITTWWFKHRGKMWQAVVLMYLSWFLGGRLLRNWNWRRHTKVAGNRKPDKTILNLTFFLKCPPQTPTYLQFFCEIELYNAPPFYVAQKVSDYTISLFLLSPVPSPKKRLPEKYAPQLGSFPHSIFETTTT